MEPGIPRHREFVTFYINNDIPRTLNLWDLDVFMLVVK